MSWIDRQDRAVETGHTKIIGGDGSDGVRTRTRPDESNTFRPEDRVEIADAHQFLPTEAAQSCLFYFLLDGLREDNLEGPLHAIMFGNRNVPVFYQAMRI